MLRDAIYGESDLMLMEHYDMRHVDAETLRKYRTVFNLHNPGHIYSDLDDKEFLIQLGGYIIDETSGKVMINDGWHIDVWKRSCHP